MMLRLAGQRVAVNGGRRRARDPADEHCDPNCKEREPAAPDSAVKVSQEAFSLTSVPPIGWGIEMITKEGYTEIKV